MEQLYFNPGCSMSLYKPEMEVRILELLNERYAPTQLHKICCRHAPAIPTPAKIINVCAGCGDVFYPSLPAEEVYGLMKRQADDMPREDVVVYCVSCIKAMHIGGKKPRYLINLLFGETTESQEYSTAEWHCQLDEYIAEH